MENDNRILFSILGLLFLSVVIGNYYNYFIKNTYQVVKQVSCNPETELCFISDCESSDSSCDSTPYKKINVQSKYAGREYEDLSCSLSDTDCKIIYCNEDLLESGERCYKE